MSAAAAITLPPQNPRILPIGRVRATAAITLLNFGVTKIVNTDAHSGVFRAEYAHDGGGDFFPLAFLAGQLAVAFFREGVKTRFAVVLGCAPRRTHEGALFEPLQCGVERPVLDDEDV